MTFQGHYIGYDTLEKLLEATSGNIFANCAVECSTTHTGMERCVTILQVARIEGEIVHYWRWSIAEVLMIAPGQPLDNEQDRRANAAVDSAWPAVQQWLGERGKVIQASVAMPKNLQYLDGQRPSFLDFEKKTAQYHLREFSHA